MSINMWLKVRGLEAAGNQMFPGAAAETAKVFRVAPDASDMKLAINNTPFNIQ